MRLVFLSLLLSGAIGNSASAGTVEVIQNGARRDGLIRNIQEIKVGFHFIGGFELGLQSEYPVVIYDDQQIDPVCIITDRTLKKANIDKGSFLEIAMDERTHIECHTEYKSNVKANRINITLSKK